MNHLVAPAAPLWTLLAGLLFLLLVNGAVIWAVWLLVKKPAAARPATGADVAGAPAPASSTGRTLAIVGGVILLCLAVPVGLLLLVFGLAAVSRKTTQRHVGQISQQ